MASDTVLDPVCGMKLEASKANFTGDYEGMRYYFCSEACKRRFDDDPEAYLASDFAAANALE